MRDMATFGTLEASLRVKAQIVTVGVVAVCISSEPCLIHASSAQVETPTLLGYKVSACSLLVLTRSDTTSPFHLHSVLREMCNNRLIKHQKSVWH